MNGFNFARSRRRVVDFPFGKFIDRLSLFAIMEWHGYMLLVEFESIDTQGALHLLLPFVF